MRVGRTLLAMGTGGSARQVVAKPDRKPSQLREAASTQRGVGTAKMELGERLKSTLGRRRRRRKKKAERHAKRQEQRTKQKAREAERNTKKREAERWTKTKGRVAMRFATSKQAQA